jgi:hypothetical protein
MVVLRTKFKDQMYGGRMLFATFTADLKDLPHTGWRSVPLQYAVHFIMVQPPY